MSQKKRGLGRGLGDLGVSELLSDLDTQVSTMPTPAVDGQGAVASAPAVTTELSANATQSEMPAPAAPTNGLRYLSVDQLQPGRYQPRKTFDQDALQELANSIQSQGMIQPIVVRRMNNGYEIIAGERRWRAAQLAGLEEVPVIIRDINDEVALAISLIENIQRQDLNSIEEAVALQRLIDEFQMTHQEVSEAVGKSRAAVTNLIRLLKLNPDVRVLVENGDIEMGHARALLSIEGYQQSEIAKQVASKGLSVRQTESLVRHLQTPKDEKPSNSTRSDPNILRLQKDLEEKLGAEINIAHTSKGKGKLVIRYNSIDELDGILAHIS